MKKLIKADEELESNKDIEAKLFEFVENAIHDMEDEYLNVQITEKEVPGYDADWCIETPTPEYEKALKQLVKTYVDEYLYYRD